MSDLRNTPVIIPLLFHKWSISRMPIATALRISGQEFVFKLHVALRLLQVYVGTIGSIAAAL